MSGLLDRAPGDDVIVPVRMRKASFEKLCADPDGRSVRVGGNGRIGLVPDGHATLPLSPDADIWTLVVWSTDPVWRGVPEQIPANEEGARALRTAASREER